MHVCSLIAEIYAQSPVLTLRTGEGTYIWPAVPAVLRGDPVVGAWRALVGVPHFGTSCVPRGVYIDGILKPGLAQEGNKNTAIIQASCGGVWPVVAKGAQSLAVIRGRAGLWIIWNRCN